jgi:hypothetical protein
MAGQRTLDPLILVRIQVPQTDWNQSKHPALVLMLDVSFVEAIPYSR